LIPWSWWYRNVRKLQVGDNFWWQNLDLCYISWMLVPERGCWWPALTHIAIIVPKILHLSWHVTNKFAKWRQETCWTNSSHGYWWLEEDSRWRLEVNCVSWQHKTASEIAMWLILSNRSWLISTLLPSNCISSWAIKNRIIIEMI